MIGGRGGGRGFHWPACKSYREEDRKKERKEEILRWKKGGKPGKKRGVARETEVGTGREVVGSQDRRGGN